MSSDSAEDVQSSSEEEEVKATKKRKTPAKKSPATKEKKESPAKKEKKSPAKKEKDAPVVKTNHKLDSEAFMKEAKPIKIVIEDSEYTAKPTIFKTGSYGYQLVGQTFKTEVSGVNLEILLSLNLGVKGTKPFAKKAK